MRVFVQPLAWEGVSRHGGLHPRPSPAAGPASGITSLGQQSCSLWVLEPQQEEAVALRGSAEGRALGASQGAEGHRGWWFSPPYRLLQTHHGGEMEPLVGQVPGLGAWSSSPPGRASPSATTGLPRCPKHPSKV